MQLSSSKMSWKGLELETEGGDLQVWWILVERNGVCRKEVCWCHWLVSRFVSEEKRVCGKRLCFSFTVVTWRILIILPPNFSEEIWAHKVEVAGAFVLAVRDGGTRLVARVLVAAFSARVAAVGSVSPAVFFCAERGECRGNVSCVEAWCQCAWWQRCCCCCVGCHFA